MCSNSNDQHVFFSFFFVLSKYKLKSNTKHVPNVIQNQSLQIKFKFFPVFHLHELKTLLVLNNSCILYRHVLVIHKHKVYIYNYGVISSIFIIQSVCNYSFYHCEHWKILDNHYFLFKSLLTDFFLSSSYWTKNLSSTIFQLWAELRLPAEPFPDKETCWHGSGIYEDCNNKLWQRNAMIRYQVTGPHCLHRGQL